MTRPPRTLQPTSAPLLLLLATLLLLSLASVTHAFFLPLPLPLRTITHTPTRRPHHLAATTSTTTSTTTTTSTNDAPPSSSSPSPSPSLHPQRVLLKGLQPDRFRHPLDQQATEQLRRLPGLEWIVRRFMQVVEEAVYLDNISSAILVCVRVSLYVFV